MFNVLFQCIMPMVMENLAITETLKYVALCHYLWRWLLAFDL